MKAFIKKTGFFILVPIAVLSCVLLNYWHQNTSFINSYTPASGVTSLYTGDSHVQVCVNDKIVAHSTNLSQSSESFYFTFYKISTIIRNNPGISRIYLGFSYHSLSSYYDDCIFGSFSKDIAPRYFFILPGSEKIKILRHNFSNLTVFLKNLLSNGSSPAFLGNYENAFSKTTAVRNSMDKRLRLQFYKNGHLNAFSTLNLQYLDEIVRLCKRHKIQLLLLNTPLHPYYKKGIPPEYLQKYDQVVNHYQLEVINLNHLPLSDSCFIPDGDHVSVEGATIVSKYLSQKDENSAK
jgi:hypothetical protein